jgi:hypothetical protein
MSELTETIFKEESMQHSTEKKLIGWLLINPELPQAREVAKQVNPKNLCMFGRVVLKRVIEIMDLYPESAQYGRMQDVAFAYAVREMDIPYKYILSCLSAASCWTPNGPTELEIKEITA